MSFKYQIRTDGTYFITFAVVDWVDVFTRKELAQIVIDSLKYCQKEKGLQIFAWCLMPSHIHLIVSAGLNGNLSNIMRDLKKFTSKQVVEAIKEIPESRRDWMLNRFERCDVSLRRKIQSKNQRLQILARRITSNRIVQ